jgi:hypothetical protein
MMGRTTVGTWLIILLVSTVPSSETTLHRGPAVVSATTKIVTDATIHQAIHAAKLLLSAHNDATKPTVAREAATAAIAALVGIPIDGAPGWGSAGALLAEAYGVLGAASNRLGLLHESIRAHTHANILLSASPAGSKSTSDRPVEMDIIANTADLIATYGKLGMYGSILSSLRPPFYTQH